MLACRNMEKGRAALAEVKAVASGPEPELEELDLASLSRCGRSPITSPPSTTASTC